MSIGHNSKSYQWISKASWEIFLLYYLSSNIWLEKVWQSIALNTRIIFHQFFKREEQNFVAHNEIDNMALIMPSQAVRLAKTSSSASSSSGSEERKQRPSGKKRDKKRLEPHNSLNVACLKRLVPVGLGFFSGREQELLQQAKQRLLQVRHDHDFIL